MYSPRSGIEVLTDPLSTLPLTLCNRYQQSKKAARREVAVMRRQWVEERDSMDAKVQCLDIKVVDMARVL